MAVVTVLDLPDHLLRQCIPPWHQTLLRVCRRFQALLLSGCSSDRGKSVKLLVHLGCEQGQGLLSLAQTVARTPAFIKLQVLGQPGLEVDQHLAALLQHTGSLACVTHVQLTNNLGPGMRLHQLLPECLMRHCPNLQHLELSGVHLTEPPSEQQLLQGRDQTQPAQSEQQDSATSGPASNAVSRCTSLRTLLLQYASIGCSLARLQQQLQQLPSLQQLHWHVWCDMGNVPYYAAFPASLCASLTELHVCISNPSQAQLLFIHPYPLLQVLELSYPTINDELLSCMLQQLPQLRQLSVKDFILQQDHSRAACSWQVLGVCTVHVASCARLPLHHVQQLQCTSLNRCSIALADTGEGLEQDMALTQRAVAAVKACGGLQLPASKPCMQIHVGANVSQYMHHDLLIATLPMLVGVCRLSLSQVFSIDNDVLLALGQLQGCRELCFANCTFENHAWGFILRSLLQVQELSVYTAYVSVEQLVALCRGATHTVRLRASRPEAEGDEQDIEGDEQDIQTGRDDILSAMLAAASQGLVSVHWV